MNRHFETPYDTTYHFIDASPAEALETAREAADGQDVRLGGGATMIRDFLAAELVDHMHIVVVPILLGRGVRLWDGVESNENSDRLVAVGDRHHQVPCLLGNPAPIGFAVTPPNWTRRVRAQ
jgi:dihydrofolate reductase